MSDSPTNQPKPLVSLLVCTYNRAAVLGQTLESLLAQNFEWGNFEIVVVDNASTDDTPAVAARYQALDSRIRYVLEPRLGVAVARNHGAREAHAPYIAYFDDDLLAEPDCLQRLMAPFFEVNPTPAAVMGKVNLLWQGQRPDWFPERFETLLSRFDRGSQPRFMTADEYLLTMNVAFERKKFLQSGGIREDLSRKGRMFICGGDTEIFQRYSRLGLSVYYEPGAVVAHLVPPARQSRRWLLKRLFGDGTTQAILGAAAKNRPEFFKEAYFDLRRCTRFLLEIGWGNVSCNTALADEGTYKFVQRAGRLFAHWNLLTGHDPRATSEP